MSDKWVPDEAVSIEPIVVKSESRDDLVTRESQMHSLYEEMNKNQDEPVENVLRAQLRFIAANTLLNNNDYEGGSRSLTWEEYDAKVKNEIVGAKFKHLQEIDIEREAMHEQTLARDAFEETRVYASGNFLIKE